MGYKQRKKKQHSSSNLTLVTSSSYPGGLWRTAWSTEVRAETHIRPTGPINKDGTDFEPWRLNDKDWEDFVVPVPVFTGGSFSVTKFIAAYGIEDDSKSVAHVFYDAVKRMAAEDESIAKLMGDKIPFCRPPVDSALIQGVLLRHGKMDYWSRPRYPVMLLLSSSAQTALEKLLEARDDNGIYLCKNLLSADGGLVFNFYNPNTEKHESSITRKVNWGNSGGGDQDDDKKKEFNRYVCDIMMDPEDDTQQLRLDIPREESGKLINPEMLFTPWEDALNFLSEKEMVEALCEAYQNYPEILRHALDRYKDMLPKFVLRDSGIVVPENSAGSNGKPSEVGETTHKEGPPARRKPKMDWGGSAKPKESSDKEAGAGFREGMRRDAEEAANEVASEEENKGDPGSDDPDSAEDVATALAMLRKLKAEQKKS